MFRRPQVPTIDGTEASRRLAAGGTPAPILLDIREPADFRVFRAPGALLRPVSTLHLTVADLPKDRPIMVACWEGNTSQGVTEYLLRSGWTDVVSVAGGMNGWRHAGLPVREGALAPGEGEL